MKSAGILSVLVIMMSGWIASYGQGMESEVPGDNFSLEGALELFKKSSSPEEFEKMLNSPDARVNNLDLNGDGYIDYIRVLDQNEGNIHAFVLQDIISETEVQDVAVIELEKQANGKAVLQIIGDEDIYGLETIIEPTREVRTYAGTTTTHTVVNVWAWPSVQYIYGPSYTLWISPWGWHLRPVWWHSWRPVAYAYYYPIWRPYHRHYAVCHTYRIAYAHEIYRPHRRTSVVVVNTHHDQLAHYRSTHHDLRNGRTRNDEGRSYAHDPSGNRQRNDVNRNRISSNQNEATTLQNRTLTRKRSVPADIHRNPTVVKRDVSNDRTSGTVSTNREIRPQATRSAVNRNRPIESAQQRSITRERSVPAAIHRNPTAVKRDVSPDRSSVSKPAVHPSATRPSTQVNRSRSSGHVVQQRPSTPKAAATKSSHTKRGRH